MLLRATFLVRGGYNVLAVDLHGHGESASQYALLACLEARDILGTIHRGKLLHWPPMELMPPARWVRKHQPILYAQPRNPSVAASSVPNRLLSWRASRDCCVYYARTGVYLRSQLVSVLLSASRIQIPVSLISGERDWVVPTKEERTIFSVLPNELKSLVIIPTAHDDTTYSAAPALYRNAVLIFLDDSLAK